MTQSKQLVYKRILLKMSGEALMGDSHFGIAPQVLGRIVDEIKDLVTAGVEVALVIGGGNLFRGAALSAAGLGRVTGDYMGMLATVMNALAVRDVLESAALPTRIMSAITMTGVVDPYDRRKAIYHLENKRVVIFAAGTGNPFFTTDSAASLRAIEIDANILLKATKVDGIYSADPLKNPQAKKYERLTYTQVLEQNLKVMDSTAICMCRDHNMPLRVFDLNKSSAVTNIVFGGHEGTLVTGE